jgi:hypothetical protein
MRGSVRPPWVVTAGESRARRRGHSRCNHRKSNPASSTKLICMCRYCQDRLELRFRVVPKKHQSGAARAKWGSLRIAQCVLAFAITLPACFLFPIPNFALFRARLRGCRMIQWNPHEAIAISSFGKTRKMLGSLQACFSGYDSIDRSRNWVPRCPVAPQPCRQFLARLSLVFAPSLA